MTGLRNQKANRQMGGRWNGSNQKPVLTAWRVGAERGRTVVVVGVEGGGGGGGVAQTRPPLGLRPVQPEMPLQRLRGRRADYVNARHDRRPFRRVVRQLASSSPVPRPSGEHLVERFRRRHCKQVPHRSPISHGWTRGADLMVWNKLTHVIQFRSLAATVFAICSIN